LSNRGFAVRLWISDNEEHSMTDSMIAHPPITSRDVWLTARKALLAEEKALTRRRDAVNAMRRRLPMVRVEKSYEFDGPNGPVTLLDLFEGRRQLIIYHFMFDPAWEAGCPGCTGFFNSLGDLSLLAARDTTMAVISRAPLEKLQRYRATRSWPLPWVSSFRSDFNYDFHASQDESIAPVEHNYRSQAELEQSGQARFARGENHGLSVFFRIDDEVFHCYSSFARGTEGITDAFSLLDATPYGRQQDFEDSPAGWPQRPTYG
jgi:predicted dithiol-disulfide oxidoreductase (DUF899 family)